jgi:hypothetical protein
VESSAAPQTRTKFGDATQKKRTRVLAISSSLSKCYKTAIDSHHSSNARRTSLRHDAALARNTLSLPLDEEVLDVEQAAKGKKCIFAQTPVLLRHVSLH